MLTRRETLVGGLLTLILGTSTAHAACSCQSDALAHNAGCMLDDAASEAAFARIAPLKGNKTTDDQPVMSSGDRELDYAIGRTLTRLTAVFGVNPGFAYYEDGDRPNANASPKVRLGRADGTVLFGLNHLRKKLKSPEAPDVHVAATCAHEYGHILQFKRGLRKTIINGQPNVKRLELHADFLAGYFAGVSKLRDRNYPAAVYAVSRHAIGDYKVEKETHHGTPDERATATVRGFETAYRERRNLNDAIQMGMNYVART